MDPGALSGATRGVAENLSQWSLALILTFTAAGGTFGGIADLLARLRLKKNSFYLIDEAISGWNFILSLLIQCVMGVCGAAAIVFVFASTTWFPREDSTQNRLWLLTLSVVAGSTRRMSTMPTFFTNEPVTDAYSGGRAGDSVETGRLKGSRRGGTLQCSEWAGGSGG